MSMDDIEFDEWDYLQRSTSSRRRDSAGFSPEDERFLESIGISTVGSASEQHVLIEYLPRRWRRGLDGGSYAARYNFLKSVVANLGYSVRMSRRAVRESLSYLIGDLADISEPLPETLGMDELCRILEGIR